MKVLLYNYSINSYTYGVIMSRNEWEAGKVVIPSHSWSKLKKGLQKAHNEQREQILKEAENIQAKLAEKFKGLKNIDPCDVRSFILNFPSSDDSGASEELAILSLKGDSYHTKKITQAMLETIFPKATNQTTEYGGPTDYYVTIDNSDKSVHWHVQENNHAVDDARNSWLGRAFFRELKGIDYGKSKKFGGFFVGNDEYNRDDGDGTNYITARFGKKGENAFI